jgi:hypothetical protein
MKMVWETQKILEDASIQVNPTAVRVPVFYGHSEAVHIETRGKITAAEARRLLEAAPGVEVVDEPVPGGYPTPVTHAAGNDPVYVGRIREDISHAARPEPLGGQRQHPQGRSAERGADCRAADRRASVTGAAVFRPKGRRTGPETQSSPALRAVL